MTTNTDTTAASGAAFQPEIERAAFDAWAMEHGYQSDELARSTLSLVGFQYFNTNVESAFQAWRAGRASALAAPAAQEAEPAGPTRLLADPERREAARQDGKLASVWRNRVAGLIEDFAPDATAQYLADRIVSELYDLPPVGVPRPQADAGAPETPEGCTPADAQILRKANHGLAAESFELQAALRGIVDQAGKALARFDIAPQADAGAVAVPEGWRLVPAEPTSEMSKAAADAWLDCGSRMCLNKATAAARAAIAAAPQAPAAANMESAALVSARHLLAADPAAHAGTVIKMIDVMLGQAPAAPTPDRAAFQADWERRHYPVPMNTRMRDDGRYGDAHVEAEWVAFQGTTPAPAAPTAAACAYAPLPKPYSAAAALGLDDLYTGDDMRAYADAHRAAPAPAAGAAPIGTITQPYTVAEIRERVASGDYSAELMLQHALLHLGAGAAPTDALEAVLDAFERQERGRLAATIAASLVEELRAAMAAAPAQEAAPLTHAELQEVKRAADDIEDCGETDVAYELLLRAAVAGYLECTRFQVLNQSALDLDAARARQEGGAA